MNAITRFIILVIIPFLLTNSIFAQNPKKILMPNVSWNPYFFSTDESKHKRGYAMEMLQHCFSEVDIKTTLIPSVVKRTEHLLKHGRIDIWVMSHRSGREEWLDYGKEPIFEDGYAMFVSSNSSINVNSVNDLNGLKVGSLLGLHVTQAYQEWKAKQPAHRRPIDFPNEEKLLKKLLDNQIDVAVMSIVPFQAYAKQHNASSQIKMIGQPLRLKEYFAVLSKKGKNIPNKKAFLKVLDQCLKTLKRSNHINQIRKRYSFE